MNLARYNLNNIINNIQPLVIRDKNNPDIILYESQPKQSLFHYLINTRADNGLREFFFGGASGPGKSTALRWQGHYDAIKYPGISTLLLKTQTTELERTVLRYLRKDLPPCYGHFNEQKHTHYYSNGSILECGHIDRKSDFAHYLSAIYDIILLEEGTTIDFDHFLDLASRLGASVEGFIPYIAIASNWGNKYHRMYKSYFYDENFDTKYEGYIPEYKIKQVCYLPGTIHDNPIYEKRDPERVGRLKNLKGKERKRFYDVSPDKLEGEYFDIFNSNVHVIQPFEIPDDWLITVSFDHGKITVAEFIAHNFKNKKNYVVYEWTNYGDVAPKKAELFHNFFLETGLDKKRCQFLGAETMYWTDYEHPDDKEPAHYWRELGYDLKQQEKKRSGQYSFREICSQYVNSLLHYEVTERKIIIIPGIAANENHSTDFIYTVEPQLQFFDGRCHKLVETLTELLIDPNNELDVDPKAKEDHWFEALKNGVLTTKPEDFKPPKDGTKEDASILYYKKIIRDEPF